MDMQPIQGLTERQFDPNVGGGVDRDELEASDFVFADERKFPVVKPGDVSDAVSAWGRYKGEKDFEQFKRRLIALCKRKGESFVNALPAGWKEEMEMGEGTGSTPKSRTHLLIEPLDLTEAVIDRENRTVRQRIIGTGKSRNKRFYPEAVLQIAAPLFEDVRTYADHPSKGEMKDRPERSIRQLTGWLTDVIYESGFLKGTRHFTRTQAGNDVWAMVEDVVDGRAPASLVGASINAIGQGKMDKVDGEDVLMVEAIDAVNSVDDVTSAAARGGFESLVAGGGDNLITQLLKHLDYDEYLEARPDFVERLKREWKVVRLEESTKGVLADADEKVKAAEAALREIEQANLSLSEQLSEAQMAQQATDTRIEKLTEENTTLRLKLAIQEALERVSLPETFKADLCERLPGIAPSEWAAIIEREQSKAKRAGAMPRVLVTDSGARESSVGQFASRLSSPTPLPGENVKDWVQRMGRNKE